MHVTIFCQVVDNFGDIGVCWRLARQLDADYGCTVELWVDDLKSFARIEPKVALITGQAIGRVTIKAWPEPFAGEVALGDIIIEAFACGLPEGVIAEMATMPKPPVWFNLEYLSAEGWVAGCHNRPSPHPRFPLTTLFFFPGFTPETGGLLREKNLLEQRDEFRAHGFAPWAANLGLPTEKPPGELWVSLFCYPSAPVAPWLDMLATAATPARLLVPDGIAQAAIDKFVGQPFRPA